MLKKRRMKQFLGSGSPYEEEFGFSRAVRDGRRIVVSGSAPLSPLGISVGIGDPAAQARQCLQIVSDAVRYLGGRLSDVVRTRIYLTRRHDWEAVAAVHQQFFQEIRPATTCLVVSELLRPEWSVEIEAEALIGEELRVDPSGDDDREWLAARAQETFSGQDIVNWGVTHHPVDLPGFVARRRGDRVGAATYNLEEGSCELVTIDAVEHGQGVGSALLEAVEAAAVESECRRLWLITTNDNLDAMRFYQRRGYSLAEVHPGGVTESRKVKPSIPLVGHYGIPLRDELVFEKLLL